jgi:hypothetical protein
VTRSPSPLEKALEVFVYTPVGIAVTAAEELPKLADKGRRRVEGQVGTARFLGQFAVSRGQKLAARVLSQVTNLVPPPPGTTPRGTGPAPAPAADGVDGVDGVEGGGVGGGDRVAGQGTGPATTGSGDGPAGTSALIVVEGPGPLAPPGAGIPAAGPTTVVGPAVGVPPPSGIAGTGSGARRGPARTARPAPGPGSGGGGGAAKPPGVDLAIPGYDALSASQVVPRLAGLSADELEAVRAYEVGTRMRNTILNRIAKLQAEAD